MFFAIDIVLMTLPPLTTMFWLIVEKFRRISTVRVDSSMWIPQLICGTLYNNIPVVSSNISHPTEVLVLDERQFAFEVGVLQFGLVRDYKYVGVFLERVNDLH